MKIRHPLQFVFITLSALVIAGCSSDRGIPTRVAENEAAFYANSPPGSTWEVHLYVIARGDTVAKIARRFKISIADLKTLNPDLVATRIKIGQKVKVYEKVLAGSMH